MVFQEIVNDGKSNSLQHIRILNFAPRFSSQKTNEPLNEKTWSKNKESRNGAIMLDYGNFQTFSLENIVKL